MATLTATVGSTTLNLSNGTPYGFITLKGGGGPEVRRVTARGPSQHGDTDLGFRLGSRDMELVVGFKATTDAILDGYRKTLTQHFKPLTGTPVKLTYTRDDAAVRQVDCYAIGNIKIDLVPEYRPGHYHRATITLRAPEPAWYNPTQGSVTVLGTSLVASQWYYAGGAIGSAQVAEFGTAPTQGQVWTYAGTPGTVNTGTFSEIKQGYTVAFRSGRQEPSFGKYAFFAGALGGSPSISFSTYEGVGYALGVDHAALDVNGPPLAGTSFMAAGTHNYFVRFETFPFQPVFTEYNNLSINAYRGADVTTPTGLAREGQIPQFNISGTARRWRSNATNAVGSRWDEEIIRYAVYVPMLTNSQIAALDTFMSLDPSLTTAQVLPIPYAGNLRESPVIAITGPVSSPSVTNITTGETLDFGTITIGAGTTYYIDTRYGQKSVLAGTVSHYGELTKESDIAEFHIAPHPEATGGTNVFYLNGTAMSAATRFSVAYYNRYTSF